MNKPGELLRAMRKAQGRTLKDVSKSADISVSHLSGVERDIAGVTFGTLVKWAGVLGYTVTVSFQKQSDK